MYTLAIVLSVVVTFVNQNKLEADQNRARIEELEKKLEGTETKKTTCLKSESCLEQ